VLRAARGMAVGDPFEHLSADDREKLRQQDMPRWTEPMLAKLTHDPFSDEGWVYERKLDGVRCLVFRSGGGSGGGGVRLVSRTRHAMNDTYPELAEAAAGLAGHELIADGEVVCFRGGVTSFSRLQGRIGIEDPAEARRSGIKVYLYLFDLLHLAGRDTTRLPLRSRKGLLRRALRFDDPIRYTPHRNGEGEAFLEEACGRHWEGLIAKRADAVYHHGRSSDWLKFKCTHRQELVIVGYTDPEGERHGFGALLLGYHDKGRLRYAGKVGTGFDDAMLDRLSDRLGRLERQTPPLDDAAEAPDEAHWVTPKLVGEVGFTEWTGDGRLRHPRFLGLRPDKDAADVVRERPGEKRLPYGSYTFEASNLDKVMDPNSGLTKGGVVDYYERIAEHLLPHARDRPLVLRRFPDGIEQDGFYQKQAGSHFPDWVETVRVSKSGGETQDLVVAQRAATLAYLGDQAALELHGWLSRRDRLDHPDQLVFDLDPPGDDFGPVREAARRLHAVLEEELGLTAFVKTTGSKGLHVVTALDRSADFDAVRGFARGVAKLLAVRHSDTLTVEQRKAKRAGRLYLDTARNAYAQTAVLPYALRAKPGAPVATPLAWDELGDGSLHAQRYRVDNIFRRLAQRDDPWAGFGRRAASLKGPGETLDELRAREAADRGA